MRQQSFIYVKMPDRTLKNAGQQLFRGQQVLSEKSSDSTRAQNVALSRGSVKLRDVLII